ncbi:MAG: hypothetical protein WD871_15555 [Xanthobacteraceae bacterium]
MNAFERLEALRDRVIPVAINHAARPFFAALETCDGSNPVVRIHSSKMVASSADRRDLLARVREACGDATVRIEAHGAKGLQEATSLEAFVRPMKGEILFDPTGTITHARRLVAYAAELRDEFGRQVKGVFWSGEWRTAYVVFDAERTFVDGKIKVSFLRDAELAARRLLLETCGADATDFVAAVRLGFEAPPVPVIAVDRRSDWLAPTLINTLRRRASMSALAAVFGLSTAGIAAAADIPVAAKAPVLGPAPAVSGPNGKIAIMGGVVKGEPGLFVTAPGFAVPLLSVGGDSRGVIIGEGSVSLPMGHSFGLQLDGAIGTDDDSHTMWGVGGHWFWRDPAKGLLGIVGSYSRIEEDRLFLFGSTGAAPTTGKPDMSRLGVEGELYAANYTVAAMAGHQWVDTVPGSNNDGFFGKLDLIWYATENLALSIGAEYSKGPGAFVTAGLELQSGLTGLTFFADGAYGEHDQYRALAGVRFYFGAAPKSLKNRHRYDDPQTNLATQSITGGFQQQFGGYFQ